MTDTLGSVGEEVALARIVPRLAGASALLGPGDDAAVLAAPDGRVVLTTDVMVDGPDFRLSWSTPYELGWKAAATNLADVAAMGGVPTGLLVALAAPGGTEVALLEGIADGLADACVALAPGAGVVGGDLTRSPVLTIAVTAAGDLQGRPPVLRSGARPGDAVAYAGELGRAAAALALLFPSDDVPALREARGPLLAAQLAPEPPVGLGPAAAGASAMLDVSDGLLLDASRIARASGVVIDLDEAALTPDIAGVVAESGLSHDVARACVLAGGEDHGLLACFRGEPPPGFRRVGTVRSGTPAVLLDGRAPDVGGRGWDSFRTGD